MGSFNQELIDLLQSYRMMTRDALGAYKTRNLTEDLAKDLLLKACGVYGLDNDGQPIYRNVDNTARAELFNRLMGKAATASDAALAPAVDLVADIEADSQYAAERLKQIEPPVRRKK